MTKHVEKRNLPYTPEQLFTLVAEVDKYQDFLPWCQSSVIKRREGNIFYADLIIGYKMIREKFGSKVTLTNPNRIDVEYLSGPMKYLKNHWQFLREQDGSCTIDFYVDFEFKNIILQNLMGVFFNELIRRMVSAFEQRAKQVYGENGLLGVTPVEQDSTPRSKA
ncbi:MAG: type II toxin-antitoxin system RatA family toxin [Alphaproteobacteria bacterium]|nr:type II toxin-antitoxin system RatA family toxin [Alphaproteobacteria bacterium]MBP7757719.1 type II toxin-antitoxin system RatA family toxin [Alphaproteobacteria bacterium]MBP7761081.1 type II toxin-antitoxin system RatA family toxin [Alphaproteobacteria bacterium]MBP7904545.1 type II toxin-antitoxin system RatA family toxin [Alphaproteobacteria bacterium]